MKNLLNLCGILLLLISSVNFVYAQTDEEIIALVKKTKADIERNAEETFESILFGDHPYLNKKNPSLYVFVLDTNLTVAAHPVRTYLAGKNLKGKPDVKGKMFREEMLKKALENGKGWVKYHYFNSKTQKTTLKLSYFELAKGSDGKKYIVGSGRYIDE